MIELLGIGVPRHDGGWLLRRICARIDAPALTVVVSADSAERRALLDVVTGQRLADEGRVWVDRVPFMRETRSKLRARMAWVDFSAGHAEDRSVFANVLGSSPGIGAFFGIPGRYRREHATTALDVMRLNGVARMPVRALGPGARLRLALARGLAGRPAYVIVPDPQEHLDPDTAGTLGVHLRRVVEAARVGVVVASARNDRLLPLADRVIVLASGSLVFDGPPASLLSESQPTRILPGAS